ncbi:MAG: hypothetical protein Phog2KO_35930 [Phototrophicaceae bacterium]
MLDQNASVESKIRYQYAQEIANLCPENLFSEIALTGSSARGIATKNSDIEINFWVDDLPSIEERKQWIQSLGVSDIQAMTEPRPDNSYWVNAIYKGIELEAGWQTFADLEVALTELIEARTTDHKALRLAELVISAKPLRGSGTLSKWQALLATYPPLLAGKLIDDALNNCFSVDWLENQVNIEANSHRIWRIIFALNHQWEINWKYAEYSLENLYIYPPNIISRFEAIQQSTPQNAVPLLLELIIDTLQLVKKNRRNAENASLLIDLFASLLP